MMYKILIYDDEKMVGNSIRRILEANDKEIFVTTELSEFREIVVDHLIDVVLLDYKLGEVDGLAVLEEIKENFPEVEVVMLTAFGSVEIAVRAMKLGAYDFIQKREEPDFIRFTIQRALDNLRLKKEVELLRKECSKDLNQPNLIAKSEQSLSTLKLAKEYAASDSTILITGETGTGKSLMAKYMHLNSPRFSKPFVSINCAAIPGELLESELFGYEKGAFTGANQRGKRGLLEQANEGTIFLDEISELTLDLQSKLLHVVESNQFFRLGSIDPIKVDIRFVAATNSDLDAAVEEKRFRIDLYYRLNVARLHLAPLRDKKEDLAALIKYFVDEFSKKLRKDINEIDGDVFRYLEELSWPGNVRELRNVIERAVLLKKDAALRASDFQALSKPKTSEIVENNNSAFQLALNPESGKNLFHHAQKLLIEQALDTTEGNRSKAAQLLGIPRTSLNFYVKKFKMD